MQIFSDARVIRIEDIGNIGVESPDYEAEKIAVDARSRDGEYQSVNQPVNLPFNRVQMVTAAFGALAAMSEDCGMVQWLCEPKESKHPTKGLRFAGPVTSKPHLLSRNSPCHCGSGKKFKKCCLNGE